MTTLTGSCLCGRVRIAVHGAPNRLGICHCTDCRQQSGSAFAFFGIWPAGQFEHSGETLSFSGRCFCPHCGARLFSLDEHEAEIHSAPCLPPRRTLLRPTNSGPSAASLGFALSTAPTSMRKTGIEHLPAQILNGMMAKRTPSNPQQLSAVQKPLHPVGPLLQQRAPVHVVGTAQ